MVKIKWFNLKKKLKLLKKLKRELKELDRKRRNTTAPDILKEIAKQIVKHRKKITKIYKIIFFWMPWKKDI